MDKVRLEFSKVDPSHYQPGAYVMELAEADGRRVLKIAIGIFEANSITVFLSNLTPPTRPLTHDLFKHLFEEFGLELMEVVIYDLKEGIFYARLICSDGNSVHEIDSRTSDAVALAIRFNCPIYTHEFILSQAGIFREKDESDSADEEPSSSGKQKELPPSESEKVERKPRPRSGKAANDFAGYSEEQLNERLNKALEEEAYEMASKIRDELNSRKQKPE